jgi:PIN domain
MSFVYLDTSVALAHILAEDQSPPADIWNESLISSRLLEHEMWNRIHARKLGKTHGDAVRELVGRTALMELIHPILDRAREPFSTPVRTLDSLHLATIVFLIENAQAVSLASYDTHMLKAAHALGIPILKL